MARVTQMIGNDASNQIQGTDGPDLIYGFNPLGPQAQVSAIAAHRVATGLTQPLFATAPPDDASRLFIVEKGGRIMVLDRDTGQVQAQPFLDLSSQVATAGEEGLLGLAFHPDYARNGLFYVNMVNQQGDTEIRRYQTAPGGASADPDSARPVLTVDQPDFTNHKGGWIGFGPDGNLYAALGDGGGAGDPNNNAQNPDSLLGKILRVDVNTDAFPSDPARNYAIPPDNLFAAGAGADEVWALGLRNPWRDSFDRGTGDFLIADVGELSWEEIDFGAAGANYGWRAFEGPAIFAANTPTTGTPTPPIHAYGRSDGRAVTGGYVYRGESEGLQGQYLFADFISARFWTLQPPGATGGATERTGLIAPDAGTIDMPTSFGEDGLGNLYVVDLDGDVFELVPQVASNDRGDAILGGGGDDMAFGGSGNDTMLGNAGADRLLGQNGADSLAGGQGEDVLDGGGGADTLFGGRDNDLLLGGDGADDMNGNLGDDTLYGGAGADIVWGGQGSDRVFGGDGDDWVAGNFGADLMTGGSGADRFEFRTGWGADTVAAFNAAEGDRILLTAGMSYALTDRNGSAGLDFGNGDELLLAGVAPEAVSSAWFVYG